MKKAVLALCLLLSLCVSASADWLDAMPADFTALRPLQRYLEFTAPDAIPPSVLVELSGTVADLHWCGTGNHWQFTLLVDEPGAISPGTVSQDGPQAAVHFRLHLEEPPFQDGDVVAVRGTLNSLYSSVIIPWILARTINGTDDF